MRAPLTAIACTLALLAAPLRAAGAKPAALLIDGKPIDVTCLMPLANGDGSRLEPIDLRRCRNGDIVIKSRKSFPDMIGFDYVEKDDREMSEPYFYYRFLGLYEGRSILFIVSSGGGTGRFTNLIALDRKGFMLEPTTEIAGGDRCNGGLSNASLAGGKLTYDADITPYDLINLAGAHLQLEAYKDLEASAASCVATVHNVDGSWTSVTLTNPDLEDTSGWTEQYRDQSCFNQVYRGYVARHQTELDRDGVARFAKSFADSCIAAK